MDTNRMFQSVMIENKMLTFVDFKLKEKVKNIDFSQNYQILKVNINFVAFR